MPTTANFRQGRDFRACVQDSLAAKDLRAARHRLNFRPALAALSGIGAALRQRLALEIASLSSFAACAIPGLPERAEMSAREAPPPARAEIRAGRAPGDGARRRERATVRDQRDSNADSDAKTDSDAASERWAADLAREYREDFHPRPVRRKPAPVEAEQRRAFAEDAARAAFLAGQAAWRAGQFLWPASRFALAHSGQILKLAAICLVLIGAAGVLLQWPPSESFPEAAAPEAPAATRPRAVWLDISKPYRFYELSAPQFTHEKPAYAARRHATGGGREDVLTFGAFADKGPFLRLSIYRHGSEKTADAPFFVDMARRAAPLGLGLGRATFAQNQATRFGDFETAALTMAAGRVTRENCRGFRLDAPEPGLTIAGFACAAGDDSLNAADFACLVNRLDLLAAADDRPLRDYFAAAGAHGGRGCAQVSPAKRR